MPTIKETIERLQRCHKPEEVIAVQIWSVEDVIEQARNREIKLTKAQAEAILDDIDQHQDASLGISWDTLDCYTDEYLREQKI